MRRLFSILTLTLVMQTAANAGTAEITGSGTWGSTAPTTEFSAPNTTWSFDFTVSNPLPGTDDGQGNPTAPVLSGEFTFNGVPISDTLSSVVFYQPSFLGGFDLLFVNTSDIFSTFGPLLYNGFNLVPQTNSAVVVGANDTEDPTSSGVITVSVPEPSTIISGGVGLISVLGVSLWRRRRIAA